MKYIPYILFKWSEIFPKSWALTGYFSNSLVNLELAVGSSPSLSYIVNG